MENGNKHVINKAEKTGKILSKYYKMVLGVSTTNATECIKILS